MNKFHFKRKTSSLLILILVLSIIIGLLAWGIVTIISESSNLLSNLNEYVNIIQNFVNEKTTKFDFSKVQLSQELTSIINSSSHDLISHISEIVKWIFKSSSNINTSIIHYLFNRIIYIQLGRL